MLVKDIHPGEYDSSPTSLTGVGGTLFFAADDGVHGPELWTTDGTEAGTVLVKDIRPRSATATPPSSRLVGDTLFFAADDGVHGRELWKSDGTEAGTVLVKDINAGGAFKVARKGDANTSDGTVKVNVEVARGRARRAAGRRVVAEEGRQGHRPPAGPHHAEADRGRDARSSSGTAPCAVRGRFTFTPCGGPARQRHALSTP